MTGLLITLVVLQSISLLVASNQAAALQKLLALALNPRRQL